MGPSDGQYAWEAYVVAVGGETFDGKPLPAWDGLGPVQKEGWEAAAKVLRDMYANYAFAS